MSEPRGDVLGGDGHDLGLLEGPNPRSFSDLLDPRSTDAVPLVGHGHSSAHHGEILQGVFEGPDGRLHRGLVTLPCWKLWSFASFKPDPNADLVVEPAWKTKTLQAARLTLRHLGMPSMGGRLSIQANVPLRWGMGSSTSDVIAAIRAVSHTFHRRLAPETVALLAVNAEVASDSVMFEDRTVLFAQREGVVLEELGRGLPSLEVLGLNSDPESNGVDTLLTPPAEYSRWEIEAFRPLLGLLRRAVYTSDVRLLGHIASASARINQRFLPKQHFDRLEVLADAVGAAGIQVAHTGSILGLLFDSSQEDNEERITAAAARLREMGLHSMWRFSTCDSGEEHPYRTA